MNRSECLQTAERIVTTDRQTTHGKPENTFGLVAGLWSAYLAAPVQPHDVAAMLALLKVGRLRSNPAHSDNWVDLAGYAACGAELANPQKQVKATWNGRVWTCDDGLGGFVVADSEDECYRLVRDRNGEQAE